MTAPSPRFKYPLSPTPLWAMIATLFVGLTFAAVMLTQTGRLACKHHTIDACIPIFEVFFGLLAGCIVTAWLASSRRRQRSITSGLILAIAGLGVWSIANLTLGPIVCRDPDAVDVVCAAALPTGVATFGAVLAVIWHYQKREPAPSLHTHNNREELA